MKQSIKRTIAAVLAAIAAALPLSARDLLDGETAAQNLKSIGLFRGVSDTDFDLARAPSRVEALVMLIRAMGEESDALNGTWSHPFTDVPAWADSYVGYAYQNGLTSGISDTEYGTGTANAATYLTFVLRSLGYSDRDGDFTWDSPYALADDVGILPDGVDTDNFLRADAALVTYAALAATMKGTTTTLADQLIADGVFTSEQYTQLNAEQPEEMYTIIAGSSMTQEDIAALTGKAVFWSPTGTKIHCDPECRSFGKGVTYHYAGTLEQAGTVRPDGLCYFCGHGAGDSNPKATPEALANSYTYEDYLNGIPAEAFN